MPQASTLWTGVQTGPLELVAGGLLVAAAALYLFGTRRIRERGRPWPAGRVWAFLAGLLAVWGAVGSGLAAYDERSVTAHIAQHILLMMVAPPLLAMGRPVVLAAQALGRTRQVKLVRALGAPAVRVPTHPVTAWVLYIGSMMVMFADRPVYDYLVAHPLVHDAAHGWLIGTGLLYWEPLLGAGTGHRMPRPARVISVLANMPFEALVGLWLRYRTAPVDPLNSVSDTQRAGEAFIVGATMVSTVWLLVIVGQWAAEAWREEARAASRPGRAEWSTPWWVTSTEVNGASGGP